jgi:uncharacterized protein YbjT (DUF2867 family)
VYEVAIGDLADADSLVGAVRDVDAVIVNEPTK